MSAENPYLFPTPNDGADTDITLRDVFAGLAAAGILANPAYNPEAATPAVLAADCYLIADHLLHERGERGESV